MLSYVTGRGIAMQRSIILVMAILVLAGCARRGSYEEPIVDLKGVNLSQYNTDKAECVAYADEVKTGRKVAGGAAAGAVVAGAVGAIIGNGDTAARGAGAGAVVGGAKGAGAAMQERNKVMRNCLINRGYKVLN